MKRRDKLVLTGIAALLAGLGAAATLLTEPDSADKASVAQPQGGVRIKNYEAVKQEVLRKLAIAPGGEEIPQEIKEAENYLLDRWGHMEDAGLTAPGIMPEGQMYFQNRRVIRGMRGNGKPVYAKAFLRPQVFHGPMLKPNSSFNKMVAPPPRATKTLGDDKTNKKGNRLTRTARRTGEAPGPVAARYDDAIGGPLDAQSGARFRKRGEGAK